MTSKDMTLLLLPSLFRDPAAEGIWIKILQDPIYFEQQILNLELNDTLDATLKRLLLKCQDFITSCRNGIDDPIQNCCGDVFDTTPVISDYGTCFTTQRRILADTGVSPFGITLNVSKTYSQG